MDRQDLNRFKSIVAALADYYEKSVNETVVSMYWQDFKEYSIEQFEKAVSDHRKDPDQGMFFPKTAHLIRQIEGTSKTKKDSREAKAERIWSDLINHLRLYGHREPFKVDDGAALAALKTMGGMNQLALLETKSLDWEGKKFAKIYLDNLESHTAFEGGCLSIAPNNTTKRLESNEVKPDEHFSKEETKRMIGEVLGRANKADLKTLTDNTENLKADAVAKAREWQKNRNGGK